MHDILPEYSSGWVLYYLATNEIEHLVFASGEYPAMKRAKAFFRKLIREKLIY